MEYGVTWYLLDVHPATGEGKTDTGARSSSTYGYSITTPPGTGKSIAVYIIGGEEHKYALLGIHAQHPMLRSGYS